MAAIAGIAKQDGADLGDANLEGAAHNSKTTWPVNFAPTETGAFNWSEMSKAERRKWNEKYRSHS